MEGKNWSILFENTTVNQNYSNFLTILKEACDKHIPTQTVLIRPDDKPFLRSKFIFIFSFGFSYQSYYVVAPPGCGLAPNIQRM
jgi:hypothetical protein